MAKKKPPDLVPDGITEAGGNNRPRNQVREADGDSHLTSRVIKRSLVVGGHKTSVSLEDVFWNELRSIAHERHVHLSQLVGDIDSKRQHCNLSSAIRLFVLENRRNHMENAQQQDEPKSASADRNIPRR